MLNIPAVTGPIYLIIGAGFLAVRVGLFSKPDIRVLGRFVIHFCIPALVFQALTQRSLAEVLGGSYLAAYAVGSLVGLKPGGMWGEVSMVGLGKLVLRTAAILYAYMATLSIYPVLAQKHHLEGFCAAALLATTVASFLSISAALWLLQPMG